MKALIISVGTGVSPTKKAINSLANAIATSIKHHNPDRTFFITTKQSQKTTLPKILKQTKLKNYETITLQDPDNIRTIFQTLQPKIQEIRRKFNYVTIDYTSGTKSMTSALTILGTIFEANALSYIAGKRKGGIVQPGTEEIRIIQPYFATTEQKIKTAIQFFNNNQYAATKAILAQIQKTIQDPTITKRIKPIINLAKAYALWDKFQHQKAFQTLKKIKKEELSPNKKFLGQLLNAQKPEPYYIADLINNAQRRGKEEEKYDDAVARLYRTIELVAQYRLKTTHNIDTSDTKPQQIPPELLKKWNIPKNTPKIKLTLAKNYELLNAKEDPLGQNFSQDKKLKDLLTKRNTSILAHNLKPVNKKTYQELLQKTMEYASITVKNLKQLIKDSTFIKWTE